MKTGNLLLAGRVAIVAGSSRGIGRATALAFAREGADVVICSRSLADELNAVAADIRKLGRRVLAIQANITQKSEVDNLVQKTIDEFGSIDILVNSAGAIARKSLIEHNEEDWNMVMDTNLKGYYFCCQSAAKRMIEKNKGTIVNISSLRGIKAASGIASYCISKAGVIMLTKVLALELASYNIRVNAIAPGWVKTDFNKSVWSDPANFKRLESTIPLGRWATPDDIAEIALFLASDNSRYVTGDTIVADGGIIA